MKRLRWLLLLVVVLVLAACSDKVEEQDTPEQGEEVGFSLTGDSIEEAENIPEDEKKAILEAFDVYITSFNEKNLDAYMDMISDHSESFDKEEELEYIETFFADYDLVRDPTDITIVKYQEDEAQVFSTLGHKLKQLSSGLEKEESARQVTVFTKEEGNWKVKSVHSIGENPTAQ